MNSTPASFEEWFGREWPSLMFEFFTSRPRMAFDAFAEMRYVNRRESRYGHAGWELQPITIRG
jgi:hypothetical protein